MPNESTTDVFARKFNFRRTLANISNAALLALVVAHEFSALLPERWKNMVESGATFAVVVGAFLVVNFFYCKCPQCRRYIGIRPWVAGGLPRGLPCDAEIAAREKLNWPY